MIAETQRPIYFEGYGLIRLSLETFTKVNTCYDDRFYWNKKILDSDCNAFADASNCAQLLFNVQNSVSEVTSATIQFPVEWITFLLSWNIFSSCIYVLRPLAAMAIGEIAIAKPFNIRK